ncbi:MULE transposase domain [Sesbania bispinosa]|nr:MULE transposase domain [Sesbania bispinosa]
MKKITRMKDILNMKKKPNMKKITRMKDILNMKKIKILNNRKKTRMKKKPNMKKIKILNIMNGFATKRWKIISSRKTGRVLQQNFFCNKEGKRVDSGVPMEERQREPKAETRCYCRAEFRAHVDINSERWFCSYFSDKHSHELLDAMFCAMLPAHRKMVVCDIDQMNNMLKKDIYNQIIKQRRLQNSDAEAAVKYLHNLGVNDPLMFTRHTLDPDNRLEHLFWCDGKSQLDYKVFGDVLAFDATYGKNKYRLPLVVFSGVNHHNRTTIFASAIVANETEETYIWLLRLFLEAMKGKMPNSVITNGDLAMRNAIRVVFPRAHHRLCAWHLARNATSNVGIPAFIKGFEHYKPWIIEMYQKREMWAATYMRGKFFVGFRTTSRCEEMEDDFSSIHGDPVLQTNLQGLERKLSVVNSETIEDFNDAMERSLKEHAEKTAKRACDMASGSEPTLSDHERLRNPLPARHKGCPRASTSTGGLRVRRTTKCSICHVAGHNKATCPQ